MQGELSFCDISVSEVRFPMDASISPPDDVVIRSMRAADLPAIVELDALVNGQERVEFFQRRLRRDAGHDESAILLAAFVHDTVIGFVMGELVYGEFGFTQVTGLLDSIAVHPQYARQGIGQRLGAAFISESARRGAQAVFTLVAWDAWDLLKFFHALGFSLANSIPLELPIVPPDRQEKGR